MNRNLRNEKNLKTIFNNREKAQFAYKSFVFSCCDKFDINLTGWEQPIISIDKLLKSSSQYNIDNIIHGKQAQAGFVIISAEKEDLPIAENNKRTEDLENWIVEAGYSFKHALGGYTYQGKDGYTKEKSFVVFNYYRDGTKGDFKDLENFAIKMCGENYCDQQSVLIAEPGKVPVYKDRNGNPVSDVEHSNTNTTVNQPNPPAYTSFKTAKNRPLPDRYETMDIAWSSFVKTLKACGITHLGNVDSTGNGHIRSNARGMFVYW